MIAIKPNVFGM